MQSTRRGLEVTVDWRGTRLDHRIYASSMALTLGSARNCDVQVGAAPRIPRRFMLLGTRHGAPVLRFCDGWGAEARLADGAHLAGEALRARAEWQDDAFEVPLAELAGLTLRCGEQTVSLALVEPAARLPVRLELDARFVRVLGLVLLAHLVLLGMVALTPPADPPEAELTLTPKRFVRLLNEPPRPAPVRPKAKGHILKEGQIGAIDRPRRQAPPSPRGGRDKRDHDLAATNVGLLKALRGLSAAASDVLGRGGLGDEVNAALGGVRGTGTDVAGGSGGMSSRGDGPGGGGKSMGIGGVGGDGGKDLGPDVALSDKRATYELPKEAAVEGCLSAEVVAQRLDRVRSQARYCYEQALVRDPNLQGKVVARFTIGASGGVTDAQVHESSLAAPDVEQCLLRIVARLRFPECRGGGVAEVTYPWAFSSAGDR